MRFSALFSVSAILSSPTDGSSVNVHDPHELDISGHEDNDLVESGEAYVPGIGKSVHIESDSNNSSSDDSSSDSSSDSDSSDSEEDQVDGNEFRFSDSSKESKYGLNKASMPEPLDGAELLYLQAGEVLPIPGTGDSLTLVSQISHGTNDNQIWIASSGDAQYVVKLMFDLEEGLGEIENEASVLEVIQAHDEANGMFVRMIGHISDVFQTLVTVFVDEDDDSEDGKADDYEPIKIQEYRKYKYIVLEVLGDAINDHHITGTSDKVLKRRIAFRAAREGIRILAQLHNLGFIHGDVHAGNFLFTQKYNRLVGNLKSFALESGPQIKLIDFGTSIHIPDADENDNYEEAELHERIEEILAEEGNGSLSPFELTAHTYTIRDDMYRFGEAILAALSCEQDVVLGMSNFRRAKSGNFADYKRSYTPSKICTGFGLETSLDVYFDIVRRMSFDEVPNYEILVNLFPNEIVVSAVSEHV